MNPHSWNFWQWEAALLAAVAITWAGSALLGKVIGR